MEECLPATYRTGDAIDNLLVKVAIRRRHASPDTSVGASAYSPPAAGVHDTEGSELRVFEFAWQQKIYGPRYVEPELKRTRLRLRSPSVCFLSRPRELLKYSQAIYARKAGQAPPGAPLSPLEADYMADLERRLDSGEPLFEAPGGVLLYTMTDRDAYVLPSEARRAFMGGGSGAGAGLPHALTGAFAEQWVRLLGGPGASSHWTPADIAAGVDQHADPRSVFAHAYKEHPYSVMYIMAAVGVDREALRARRPDTAFTEVALVQVRAYGRRGGAIVLDMKPGFSDVVPYGEPPLFRLCPAPLSSLSSLARRSHLPDRPHPHGRGGCTQVCHGCCHRPCSVGCDGWLRPVWRCHAPANGDTHHGGQQHTRLHRITRGALHSHPCRCRGGV
jgi:hypothetical protein